MNFSIYQIAALFLIYSCLGWCIEVAFVAVTSGKVVNRGFLNGPLCPIYGVGMLGVLLLLGPVEDSLPLLFLGGMLLCSLVELIGGWLLEKVFDTRWWDYSDQPFNLGGYICLRFSLMWGLAVTFAVKLIHPAVLTLVDHIPALLGIVLLAVLYGLFLADFVVTLVTIAGIKRRLGELQRVADALHAVGDAVSGRVGGTALAADAKLDEIVETGQEKAQEGREKISSAIATGQGKAAEGRQKLEEKVAATREEMQLRRAELEEKQKKILAEARGRFGFRRILNAFPDIRQSLQDRLDRKER